MTSEKAAAPDDFCQTDSLFDQYRRRPCQHSITLTGRGVLVTYSLPRALFDIES